MERILAADKRALRRQGKVDQRTVATPNTAITNFPEEIRSGKILFDGIEHLRWLIDTRTSKKEIELIWLKNYLFQTNEITCEIFDRKSSHSETEISTGHRSI